MCADFGGARGCGTVFELSLVKSTWTQSVLYSFQGENDGIAPAGSLLSDAAGNLYGTTEVGGGSPNSNNPAGNGAAGTGNPSLNAVGGGPGGNGTNTPGISNARTTGSNIGGYGGSTGVAPASNVPGGGTSPEALRSQRPPTNGPTAPKDVQGVAEEGPISPTGLSKPGPDGVSTVIVAARSCGVAAHETDGTTTCIGIPDRSPNLRRRHRR